MTLADLLLLEQMDCRVTFARQGGVVVVHVEGARRGCGFVTPETKHIIVGKSWCVLI